jgi:predicted RecB family nuclease
MPITISKSKFVAGAQCLKRLYLQVHQPELAAEPNASGYAIMEQGQEVGRLAHQLFPGGVKVDGSDGLGQAIRTTQELIANPEVPAIFEGTFSNGDVLVRVDILHRRRDNRWRLIEVKSTTDLKEYHLDDVAIQHRVVSRSGLDLASSCLAHINRNYVFDGGSIDVRRFFKIRNLTQRVERLQPKLTFLLRSEFRILAFPQPPPIPVGSHCTDPITCEFYDRCNPPRPDDHIGYIPRIHASAVEELEELGIQSIHNIPDDFPLNERQRRAATSVQTGEPWFSPTGVAAVAQCGDRIPRITQYPVGSFLPGSTPY